MHVGFAVVARDGHVEFRMFGRQPAHRPALVASCEEGDTQAVLMGRLYYRDDLRSRLGAAADTPAQSSDAALALASYRTFGLAGVERLEGDFALAILDRKEQRLIASRDPMGGYPIYWLQRDGTVAVATGLRPLVDLLPIRSIDVGFLAETLMLPFAEIDYFEGTAFEGIGRLVPGSLLTVDLARRTAVRREFWNWPERVEDPGTDRVGAIAERYGELLRAATRERLRGSVASHLSGGMDSTTVALLARDELDREGQPLHALSLVYKDLSSLDRETPYLESALERPGIVPHRIIADDILDYDLFRDTPLHDEPYTGLFRAGLDIALTDAAAAAGADTILTGLGADEMLATVPFYIADLLRRGHIREACSESARWARAHDCSVWRFLRPFGLVPLMPAWAQPGLGPLLRGGYADWPGQNAWTIAPWVLPEFARRGRLQDRARAHIRRTYRSPAGVVRAEALARVRYTTGDWARCTLAAPRGIVVAHPFRDPRVLAFGLGARSRVRPVPGQQKVVLAEAMRDVLPETILRRRSKAHYNSVYFTGLSRNLPRLEAMVRDSTVDALGLFDKDRLVRCLKQAALGVRAMNGVIGLNNSLAIVQWLSLLPRWLDQPVEPVRVIDGPERPRRDEAG